ncbi:MAG: sulfur carrier protein ThiS [Planctomycetota bacterium]|jgi:sulfur carrier protein
MIEVKVNGESRELVPGTTVAALIDELGLRPELVAVEINRRLVPRKDRGERILATGDEVELVTLVGGG